MKQTYLLIALFVCNFTFAQPDWTYTSCDEDAPTEFNMTTLLSEGNVVIIDFSAMWCGPCITNAPKLEAIWQDYNMGADNLWVFDFLIQDLSGAATDCDDIHTWETDLDLTYPGFADCSPLYGTYDALYGAGYIPLILVFLPNEDGTGELVYDNITGIGVVTGDVGIDIRAILDANNVSVGVEENVAEELQLFPNPTNGPVTFANLLNNVEVYNSIGEMVYSAATTMSLDLSTLPNGLYMVKSDEGIQKVIKK